MDADAAGTGEEHGDPTEMSAEESGVEGEVRVNSDYPSVVFFGGDRPRVRGEG